MSPRRTAAVVLRYAYLLRGSPSRTMPLFAWVAVDVVLWGFITRYLNTVAAAGLNFVPLLLGAVLFWDFFGRVMHGVTMTFFEDVWSRNFLNLFATPLRISEYLAGLVLSAVATSSISLLVMVAIAVTAFGLSFSAYGLLLPPFLFVLFLFGIALGIFASAVVLRFGPASEWFVWPIPGLLSPFAAVFYPVASLPFWMQPLSRLLPPTYVFESLRGLLSGAPVPGTSLLWGISLAFAYLVLACCFFSRVYRSAVRTGLLARYTAESVS